MSAGLERIIILQLRTFANLLRYKTNDGSHKMSSNKVGSASLLAVGQGSRHDDLRGCCYSRCPWSVRRWSRISEHIVESLWWRPTIESPSWPDWSLLRNGFSFLLQLSFVIVFLGVSVHELSCRRTILVFERPAFGLNAATTSCGNRKVVETGTRIVTNVLVDCVCFTIASVAERFLDR